MPKRLNQDDRNVLRRLVNNLVQCSTEEKARDVAYTKIFPKVREAALKQFPEKEMAVLRKYNLTKKINHVNVQLTPGGVEEFEFGKDDLVEIPASDEYRYYNRVVTVLDEKATELVNSWQKANEKYDVTLMKKREMYYNFIEQAKTYEQVLEVWPEAAQVANSIMSYLPATVTEETIAAIKADSETRLKVKK